MATDPEKFCTRQRNGQRHGFTAVLRGETHGRQQDQGPLLERVGRTQRRSALTSQSQASPSLDGSRKPRVVFHQEFYDEENGPGLSNGASFDEVPVRTFGVSHVHGGPHQQDDEDRDATLLGPALRGPIFLGLGPPSGAPTMTHTRSRNGLTKNGLAKNGLAQIGLIRMAKKVGLFQHNTHSNTTQHVQQHNTTHTATQHNTTHTATQHNTHSNTTQHTAIQHNTHSNTTQHIQQHKTQNRSGQTLVNRSDLFKPNWLEAACPKAVWPKAGVVCVCCVVLCVVVVLLRVAVCCCVLLCVVACCCVLLRVAVCCCVVCCCVCCCGFWPPHPTPDPQRQTFPPSADCPNFRSFFSLSRPHFLCLSGCLLVEFWWCF